MKYINIIATIGLGAVLLGLPTINVNHFLNLPRLSTIIAENGIITRHSGFFNQKTTVDITLNDEIKTPQTVKDIVKVLREAKPSDKITFHIVGVGGDLETVFYIVNNINSSKAKVYMSVEGNAYSGHAYLAVLGAKNGLHMANNVYLMFHTFAGYGFDCSLELGIDRTVSNFEHCTATITALQNEVTTAVMSMNLLTQQEKFMVLTGHDVYITDKMFNDRMRN